MTSDKIALIKNIVDNQLRPRARIDGGDILFEKMEGQTVYLGAYADCATCPCCKTEFPRWLERQIRERTGERVEVRMVRHVPYFAR